MADANRLAAALRYQQNMEGPVTMNPNIAEQGRKGRANMAPPTSVMDPRSRDYERRARETENFLIGADILAGALPFAPLAKGAAMAAGRYAGPELARGLENYMVKSGAVLPMDVWHGSPHRFPPTAKNPLGEFDPMKIGTGEGAQAYGVGAGYLAEAKGTATGYRDTLAHKGALDLEYEAGKRGIPLNREAQVEFIRQSIPNVAPEKAAKSFQNANIEARNLDQNKLAALFKDYKESKQGSLYKVDLPDEQIAKMLDYDKPLSQQPKSVQAALSKYDADMYHPKGNDYDPNEMGSQIINRLAGTLAVRNPSPLSGSDQASQWLKDNGIPGIRYLDQGSRAGGAGTSNFVVFDPAHMNIIGRE